MCEFTRVSSQGSLTGVLIEKEHEGNRPTGYFHNTLYERQEGNADMDKSSALPLRASQTKKR